MLSSKEKSYLLKSIKDEVLSLKSSPLYEERIKNSNFPVIGEGNHNAIIMFIGEAPGAQEAKTGKPFCGSAGKILDECFEKINLDRKSVYITNILKDRPPKNRDPLPEEIEIYAPFLDRQVDIIKPKIIVTLGRFALEHMLHKFNMEKEIKPITKMHGKSIDVNLNYGIIKLLFLLHPAVAIYNRHKKDFLLNGFLNLKNILEKKGG